MTPFKLRLLLAAAFAGVLAIASPARAQMTESELVMRLNRLEGQVRQLTGQLEQLQFRNQQLEQQLARGQQAPEPPPRAAPRALPQPQAYPPPQPQAYPPPQPQAHPPQAYPPQQAYPQQQPSYPVQQQAYPPAPQPVGGRRGDAFDPNAHPNAPGAPRTLGNAGTIAPPPPLDNQDDDEPQAGAPGGRQAGQPLDLNIMAEEAANSPPPPQRREVRQIPGALPPPPPRNPSGTGAQQMVMAPTNTPKDEFDLAYGYVLRKDYALAEDSLRAFVKKYPNDRLAADAGYWLGETMFQRQKFREAAEAFLDISTKHERSAKAPDSLLRLGQSLAALKEKEAACATLAEIPRKYPKAAANVKQSVEREQKRTGCL
jgi:tol-pal system protein YbgF